MAIRDTRMMAKALEQRWPIKPEYREAIVRKLVQIIANPSSSPREVTAATRALMAAESQNQEDEHKALSDFRQRIIDIAERCGINASVLRIGEATSFGPTGGDGSNVGSRVDES